MRLTVSRFFMLRRFAAEAEAAASRERFLASAYTAWLASGSEEPFGVVAKRLGLMDDAKDR